MPASAGLLAGVGLLSAFLAACAVNPRLEIAAMAGALIGIGKRNAKLNRAAVRVAKQVGPIDFTQDSERKCDPFDPLKQLTSDYLKKKLAG